MQKYVCITAASTPEIWVSHLKFVVLDASGSMSNDCLLTRCSTINKPQSLWPSMRVNLSYDVAWKVSILCNFSVFECVWASIFSFTPSTRGQLMVLCSSVPNFAILFSDWQLCPPDMLINVQIFHPLFCTWLKQQASHMSYLQIALISLFWLLIFYSSSSLLFSNSVYWRLAVSCVKTLNLS